MRPILLFLSCFLLAACESPPTPTPAPTESTLSKIGVVGLVQLKPERAINQDNWKTAIVGVLRNEEGDRNANVAKMIYEVTVFYDAGQQDVIILEKDPQLKPGQRVRVTGNKVEPLSTR